MSVPDPGKDVPEVLEGEAAIRRARETRARQCPATTRDQHPVHPVREHGVQCKYAAGHRGEHAGPKGFGRDGDVFWSDDAGEGSQP
jgi:hypothetical protein